VGTGGISSRLAAVILNRKGAAVKQIDEDERVMNASVLQDEVRRVFALQQAHRPAVAQASATARLAKLEKLRAAIVSHRDALCAAMWRDFHRPAAEVQLTEIQPTLIELSHVRKYLAEWMRPQPVDAPWVLMNTRSEIRYEPRGVVLILAPWNYPFGLVITPLIAAVAAGNCAIVRPSEKVPETAAVIAQIIRDAFDENEVACFTETGTDLASTLLTLPFDHIFFTGSPRVGRLVMSAAATHLSSVTLELGGKSPLIVDDTADAAKAGQRAAWGKYVNAGQTCIAPDYALVHEGRLAAFVDAAKQTIEKFYGRSEEERQASTSYARAIDDGAFLRLRTILDDAAAAGARVEIGGRVEPAERYIAPTILSNVTWDSPAMREEIFGPILPVVTFRSVDEAIDGINRQGKPLALYMFSGSQANVARVLQHTSSGGVAINTVMTHFANPHLPFGGVGESGQGSYHGWHGFKAFSHERSVLTQVRGGMIGMFDPPYTGKTSFLLKLLGRVIR
jgi:aldehyde dehydrogenase (NAD+)